MPILGGAIAYRILRMIAPAEPMCMNGSAYVGRSKLATLLGPQVWDEVRGKTVIDFGCGSGAGAIELAKNGARQVYGIDIQDRLLVRAAATARTAGCKNVIFAQQARAPADVIITIDAFEHFSDPASVLENISRLLKPGGVVLASFGPTWFHPLGGHLFSVFPWAHLVFSEKALCRWRSHFKKDGARRFAEVDGGLNQMTIARFERIVSESPLAVKSLETVPIRRLERLHNRWTRELFTSFVRCQLVLR